MKYEKFLDKMQQEYDFEDTEGKMGTQSFTEFIAKCPEEDLKSIYDFFEKDKEESGKRNALKDAFGNIKHKILLSSLKELCLDKVRLVLKTAEELASNPSLLTYRPQIEDIPSLPSGCAIAYQYQDGDETYLLTEENIRNFYIKDENGEHTDPRVNKTILKNFTNNLIQIPNPYEVSFTQNTDFEKDGVWFCLSTKKSGIRSDKIDFNLFALLRPGILTCGASDHYFVCLDADTVLSARIANGTEDIDIESRLFDYINSYQEKNPEHEIQNTNLFKIQIFPNNTVPFLRNFIESTVYNPQTLNRMQPYSAEIDDKEDMLEM